MSIGLSGLRAAQAGLSTTGQNISNVNTAGFSRQQTVQTASTSQFTGSGYIGTGVDVTTVQRVYSDYLTAALRETTGTSAAADAYSTQVSQVDGYLADSSSNLSSATDSFFAAVQAVSNNPSDAASRQTMLSTAQTLTTRFNDLSGRLQAQGAAADRQIDDSVSQVNTLAQQVAVLNRSILSTGSASGSQPPNDLLDQRDALMQQISGLVGGTALQQSDGTLSVFVGNGQPLVVGSNASTLTTIPDDQDPTKKQLAVTINGQTQRVATQQSVGGTIGGLLQFRDDILTPTENSLGQIAIGLGSALNAQNQLGQDANGNPGAALFTIPAPVVTARATNSTGAALAVTITNPSQLTASDYRLDYDGTNYTLTDLSKNTSQQFSSLPQTVDGIQIAVSSPLAAGDRFTISPTRNGASGIALAASDPSAIAAAAPVALSVGSSNTGAAQLGSLTVATGSSSWPANLQTPVAVEFHVSGSTTTYDLVDPSTNAVLSSGNAYSAGTTISQNGWNLTLTGAPADGDTFTVGPNTGGTGDNRNALLLAAVQQATVTSVGSAQTTYNGLVGLIGDKAQEASSLSTSESNLLSQSQDARDSVSGVNLDEEAVNLQKYQQAYQAASKSIATAEVMFESILALFTTTT